MRPDTPTRPANEARHTPRVDAVPEDRLRGVPEDAVAALAGSTRPVGQRLPVTVREIPGPGGVAA
jgi:hypothetical protein